MILGCFGIIVDSVLAHLGHILTACGQDRRVSRMELDIIKKMTALVEACNKRGITFGTAA